MNENANSTVSVPSGTQPVPVETAQPERGHSVLRQSYSWMKRATPVLAFLAAIFAVPKGVMEVYSGLISSPRTKLIPDSYLQLSYKPTDKSLGFSFAFTAANDGSTYDAISATSAVVERLDRNRLSRPLISLNESNVEYKENSVQIQDHFIVSKDATRQIACTLRFYLTDQLKSDLLAMSPDSQRRLTVTISGNKPHTLKYCFDISQSVTDDLFSADVEGLARFPFAECSSN